MKRVVALLATLTTTAGIGGFAVLTPASAQAPPDSIVAESPTATTPNVLDGAVRTIAQIGDTVYVGGTFLQVAPPGNTDGTAWPFLVAFDAETGQIDTGFNPGLDGTVNKIVPAPDGNSIYIGGSFNDVDGVRSKSVARLDATTGARIAAFSPPAINGMFWDLALVEDRLIVGGNFTRVGPNDRMAIASLDAQTGAFDPYMNLGIDGTHGGGATNVRTLAVRPDGAELVIGGNFSDVAGQSRRQVAVVDLGTEAALSSWATSRFEPRCHRAFNTYLRDIEYSPDGAYFVVVTTGAGFQDTMCDAASRWESGQDGPGQQPTWVSYTGGDTLTGVEITDSVVYAGGHQRWMNNPFGSDFPSQGAVERSGISALDPRNGVPFSWDPGRPRGYGVWDFLTTSEGMYVGHDTMRLGGSARQRIGLLPHAGGTQLPPDEIGGLPNEVIHLGGLTVTAIPFDGSDAGDPQTVDDPSWINARAATMIDDTLFVARSNGTLTAQTFDGETFGSPSTVDLNNIPEFQTDLAMMTGMFFDPDDGRLYYTRTGSNTLFYRAFTPESRIIDPRRETASGSAPGFTPSLVRGMFLADGKLYFAHTTGELGVVAWDGGPSGSATVANSSRDWRGALFLRPSGGPPPPPPNELPVAAFSYSCVELTCEFDASDSTDSDGEIVDYAWEFGDSSTGSGVIVEHTYGTSDSHDVTLTVTDDDDATDATTVSVTVSDEVAELALRANASTNGNGATRQVTVPGEVEAGDGMLLFVTQNGSAELSGPDGWTLVESHDSGGLISTLYQREATAADPGSVVAVTGSTVQKINMELLAYVAAAAAPVADYAVVTEEKFLTEHTSPSVDVTVPGAWAVTFFADKSSSTESWTEPVGAAATRSISIGSGGGRITSLAADSDGPVGSPYGGLVAETNVPSSSSVAWTVVLAPDTDLAAQGVARSRPAG